MAFTLSVSIKKHLMFRPDHVGGSIGLRLSFTEFLILVIIGLAIFRRRGALPELKLDKGITCAFAVCMMIYVLSAIFGNDIVFGLFQVIAFLQAFLLFAFLTNYLTSVVRLRIFIAGALLGLAMQSSVAIVQSAKPGLLKLHFLGAVEEGELKIVNGHIVLPDVDHGTTEVGGDVAERPSGMLIHPNLLALYLALTLPLAVGLLLASNSWRYELFVLVVLGLGMAALYLSLSRSGWLGFLAAVMLGTAWWKLKRPARIVQYKRILLVVVVLAGIVGVASKAQKIYLRFTESADQAITFRRNLGFAALRMVGTHPFLGVGLNSFETVVEDYDPTTMSRYKQYPVHNIFLLELAETGVFGAAAFLVLWGIILRRIFKEANRCPSPLWKVFTFASGCGLVGFFVGDMSNFLYRNPIMTLMVWVQVALALAAARIGRQQHSQALAGEANGVL